MGPYYGVNCGGQMCSTDKGVYLLAFQTGLCRTFCCHRFSL